MPEYAHTLIPERPDFVPKPEQIGSFVEGLGELGAAPLKPVLVVYTQSGESRSYVNPFTGKQETKLLPKTTQLKSVPTVRRALNGLDEYDLEMAGKGPPKLPALAFHVRGGYDFAVRCCLRPDVVSTSDWHSEVSIKRKVALFGEKSSPKNRAGVFHRPRTLEVIEVPKAGCARFWVEFVFGKSLFPDILDNLNLIEPKIIASAQDQFGVKFVQGCHWCA